MSKKIVFNMSIEYVPAVLAGVIPALRRVLTQVASEKGNDGDAWLDGVKADLVQDYMQQTYAEGISYEAEAAFGVVTIEAIESVVEAARADLKEKRASK